MPKLSVIIPVLNEEYFLAKQQEIYKFFLKQGHEVIIVDGGSSDKTVQIAGLIGCKIFITKPARGHQLHFGAKQSLNEILLFLHADTFLPQNAIKLICIALTSAANYWGRFDISFSSSKLIFQIIAWFMNKRSCLSGIVTGDHALFVKRASYFSCGGFPDYPIMEDIEISKRLKKIASPICLTDEVVSSCRKWEKQGVLKTIIKMWSLRILFFFGISTKTLAEFY